LHEERKRRIDAAAPSHTLLGSTIDVLVQVRMTNSPRLGPEDFPTRQKPETLAKDSRPFAIDFPRNKSGDGFLSAKLKVRLVAPHFEICGSAEKELEVPPSRYSEKLVFLLKARRQGEGRINIELLTLKNHHIRTIPLSTDIDGMSKGGTQYATASLVVDVGNSSEDQKSKLTNSQAGALNMWREKLSYLQVQEAVAADPEQKFSLAKKIEEAKGKVADLELDIESKPRATALRPLLFRRATGPGAYKMLLLPLVLTLLVGLVIAAWFVVPPNGAMPPNNTPSSRDKSGQMSQALLLGYESALALAKSNVGQAFDFERASIEERIRLLGIEVEFPEIPAGADKSGTPTMQFVITVAAKLNAREKGLAEGFLLGWEGYIEQNSPGTFPDFDIDAAAARAGIEMPKIENKENVYNELIRRALAQGSELLSEG